MKRRGELSAARRSAEVPNGTRELSWWCRHCNYVGRKRGRNVRQNSNGSATHIVFKKCVGCS